MQGRLMLKAKYSEPCTNCGYCCNASLCPVAEQAFPEASAPCPGRFLKGGLTFCGLVLMEKIAAEVGNVPLLVTKMLGIGCGCSCPDVDTTEEQMKTFDKLAYIQMYGA